MLLAEKQGISVEAALKIFYESDVYKMMSTGEAELHCRSDYYILDEILIEIEYSKLVKNGFVDRMLAYEKAFRFRKSDSGKHRHIRIDLSAAIPFSFLCFLFLSVSARIYIEIL